MSGKDKARKGTKELGLKALDKTTLEELSLKIIDNGRHLGKTAIEFNRAGRVRHSAGTHRLVLSHCHTVLRW